MFDYQAVKYCISACYFGILWDLHHLEELAESGADACKEVRQKLSQFMDCMKDMLTLESNQLYKEEVGVLFGLGNSTKYFYTLKMSLLEKAQCLIWNLGKVQQVNLGEMSTGRTS